MFSVAPPGFLLFPTRKPCVWSCPWLGLLSFMDTHPCLGILQLSCHYLHEFLKLPLLVFEIQSTLTLSFPYPGHVETALSSYLEDYVITSIFETASKLPRLILNSPIAQECLELVILLSQAPEQLELQTHITLCGLMYVLFHTHIRISERFKSHGFKLAKKKSGTNKGEVKTASDQNKGNYKNKYKKLNARESYQ